MESILEWAASQPLWVWPLGAYALLTAIVAATPSKADDEALARAEGAVWSLLQRLAPLRPGSLKLPGSKP